MNTTVWGGIKNRFENNPVIKAEFQKVGDRVTYGSKPHGLTQQVSVKERDSGLKGQLEELGVLLIVEFFYFIFFFTVKFKEIVFKNISLVGNCSSP